MLDEQDHPCAAGIHEWQNEVMMQEQPPVGQSTAPLPGKEGCAVQYPLLRLGPLRLAAAGVCLAAAALAPPAATWQQQIWMKEE